MTELQIETDVFQTWQFDFIYKKSFVERKHVTDDDVGKHTLLESVALGERVVNNFDYYTPLDDKCYVIQVSELLPPYNTFSVSTHFTDFGGIPASGYAFITDNLTDFETIINNYRSTPTAIYNAYMIPKALVNWNQVTPLMNGLFLGQAVPMVYHYQINKPTTVNGYTPRNKKLLTYPYCYLLLSNNNGGTNILHYEKFTSSDCEFAISGVPVTGGSCKCTPEYYTQNQAYNEEEGILQGKYPILNWSIDNYQAWLLTNKASLQVQKSGSAISTVGGYGTFGLGLVSLIAGLLSGGTALIIGGLAGAIGGMVNMASGINQYEGVLANDFEHSLVPDSSSGLINGGDINVCQDNAGFFFYHYSIKKEYAEIIDNYFDMFGYKVNSLEVPNLHTRTNWNFLKLIEPNIEGNDIPEKDLEKYKQMLSIGVTFWHNISTFRDYSQTNSVI